MVYPFLENVIYSITVYEVVTSHIHQNKIFDPYEREFWVNIINNSIQMAIVDWCKVFGSENDDSIHYLTHCDFTLDGIDSTKQKMVRFRNKFIAHKAKVKVCEVDDEQEKKETKWVFNKPQKGDLDKNKLYHQIKVYTDSRNYFNHYGEESKNMIGFYKDLLLFYLMNTKMRQL